MQDRHSHHLENFLTLTLCTRDIQFDPVLNMENFENRNFEEFTFKTGSKFKPPHFIIYLQMSPPLVYSLSFGCLKPKQHSEDFHNLNIT